MGVACNCRYSDGVVTGVVALSSTSTRAHNWPKTYQIRGLASPAFIRHSTRDGAVVPLKGERRGVPVCEARGGHERGAYIRAGRIYIPRERRPRDVTAAAAGGGCVPFDLQFERVASATGRVNRKLANVYPLRVELTEGRREDGN